MSPRAVALCQILGSVLTAVSAQIAMKSAMLRVGTVGASRGVAAWRPAVGPLSAGLVLYAVSCVLWLAALSRVELSFAFPFVSLSYVGILLAARLRFGERLSASRLVGSALIVAGVLWVSAAG